MNGANGTSRLLFLSLAAFAAFIWYQLIIGMPDNAPRDYFLDVGQGDAELVILPGNIKVMTDAGPDKTVLTSLARALPPGDRYIDLAIVSHPQLDHFNGYNFILDQYDVGAFIVNGRSAPKGVSEWPRLLEKIRSKHIPLITLGAGDRIRVAAGEIDLLSPDPEFAGGGELNDTGLVELVKTPAFRTLLAADTGFDIEKYLVQNHFDIHADVLKVGHHGSKYSSGNAFLEAVDPSVAVIEVGARNTYGHPTRETLARIVSSTNAKIFRTDQNGTVEVVAQGGKLQVLTEK